MDLGSRIRQQRMQHGWSQEKLAELMGVSRQAVCDNLTRTEEILRRMEENIGCVSRYGKARRAIHAILDAAETLAGHSDPAVCALAQTILAAAHELEE